MRCKVRNPPKKYLSELSLVTYLPKDLCVDVLLIKLANSMIEYAELILHDRDQVEPHCHIYIRLPRAREVDQIVRWFRGVDQTGNLINTFAEPMKDSYTGLHSYFLHSGYADKYQYTQDDIVTFGEKTTELSDGVDCTYTILSKLMAGYDLLTLVKEYGKDFLYHYRNYKEIMADINDTAAKEYHMCKGEYYGNLR